MELSVGLPAAAAAAAAAADPPPFSGPDTPSARSMLSRRISCGSGGSSSWAPRILRPDKQQEAIGQGHDKAFYILKQFWINLLYLMYDTFQLWKQKILYFDTILKSI